MSRQIRAPLAAVIHDLAGAPYRPGSDDVSTTHLPTADPDHFGQSVHNPLHGELRLVGTKAPKGPADRIVGSGRHGLDIDHGDRVGAGGMTGGPLEHLHAHRGVGAGIADHPSLESREPSLPITSGPNLDTDRVALGVNQMRLVAGDGALDGPVEQEGGEGGLGLVGEILLPAKGATVGDQFDGDGRFVEAEDRCDLIAVIPDPLST